MKKNQNYPLYEVVKFNDFKEMLELAEKNAGGNIAFKYRGAGDTINEVSYSRFIKETKSIGTALADLNMADKHIAIVSENSYKWVTVYLSALNSSGVFIPIDKDLPLTDILNIAKECDVLFFSKKYEEDLRKNLDKIPNVKHFIGLDLNEDTDNFLSYNKFLTKGRTLLEGGDKRYTDIKTEPELMKMIVYTSGTTGMAKGVMLSTKNLVSGVYYGLQVSTVFDTCLSVLPYHHTYESVCGLLVSLHMHSTICINDNLKNVLKNLQLFKPSYILLVPAFAELFYSRIWSTAEKEKKSGALKKLIKISSALRKCGIDMRSVFFKSIRAAFGGRLIKIVSGGAPIRPEIGEFFDAIGINLINGYGITECSPLVSANRDYYNDSSTVGIKLPCCEIKLDDINEDGNGEICVKGDIVMLGYYNNPEETAKVLHDGWFSTGDYGIINEEGQLKITGRKKNLIVLSNGKNVYPEEIENYILSVPYVSEVVVTSIRNEYGEESALCAEIFPNSEKLEEMHIEDPLEAIKSEVKKACIPLPSYKHIAKIVLRTEPFAKTTSNKIKRNTANHHA